jgi:RimJ/RimL family protein N-acetyltransferase
MSLSLILLNRNDPAHVSALQTVLEATPGYHLNTGGVPAGPDEAKGTLSALPPKHGYDTKFVYGVELEGKLIGCADVIRGYPEPHQAMLGLLLLSEDAQGKGRGQHALSAVEEKIRAWPEIRTIRIGVVESNEQVLGFWKKMGFKDTGARRPYEQGNVRSQTIVLEKPLTRA